MKKLIKWGIKIILGLAVLAVFGLVALRLMFPPEKIKQLTLNYAKNTFNREIKFDSVSFNLIGITLNNFAMSEENSFAQGTFVKADRVEAKAALWPLLKKRVEIAAVRIDGLDVFIQKNKDGSFNFDSFSSGETTDPDPEQPASDSSSEPFDITAQLIKIRDCDFYYKDLQTGLSSALEDLDIQLANVALDKPFPLTLSLTSQTTDSAGLTVSIPVNINLTVFLANFNLPQAYVDITHAQAQYRHVTLSLQGKAENFDAPQVNLSGSITGLDNLAFKDFLPDLPNFTLPVMHLALQASANLQDSSAVIQNAALRMLDSALSVNGNLGWGGENVTYRLSGKLQADIAQIVKMADDTGFDPKGTLSGTFTATEKKDGQDVSGSVTLKNISALYAPFTLTNTNGTIKIASLEDISCASLTGLLNNEKFTASFAYKNIKDVLDLTLKLNLDKLTLTQFPSFDTPADDTATAQTQTTPQDTVTAAPTYMNIKADVAVGPVSVPYFRTDGVTIQSALTNVSADMQKANGTVSFAIQPGAITDMENLLKQSKVVRIILLPLGLLNKVGKKLNLNLFEAENQAKKGEIAMTKAEGKYTFTNGVMNIDTTTFESSLTNLNATGTADFNTNALDMKASATLLTKQTPVVIKIGGTLDNPTGRLDVLHTVTSVVGGILSYQTAKSAVKGTGEAATSVASGAAKTTSDVAGTAVKDTAKAAKATVKALGSLFKKNQQPTQESAASKTE